MPATPPPFPKEFEEAMDKFTKIGQMFGVQSPKPKPSLAKSVLIILVFLSVVLALVAVVAPFLAGLAWSLAAHALRAGQFH
jgi:antibiotic biosynthesis monooxygenase (ABM) superfamily enzyme